MSDEAISRRLKMLLQEDDLVEIYLANYGENINIAHIKELKENATTLIASFKAHKPIKRESPVESIGIGDDPIYEATLICPVCKERNVTSYNLRAKSQFITENHFLVPLYAGIGKYRKENFTKLATTVCQNCLFASPDPKDFSKFIEYTEKFQDSQLKIHPKLLFHLEDTTSERLGFLRAHDIFDPQFLRPRTTEVAILSIRLSIMRAELEQEHDLRNTKYKIGAYNLKIAQLQKESGIDNVETLKIAAELMESAVINSDCNSFDLEMQALYLTIALNIKLRNKDKISGYMKVMKDIEMEVAEELKQNQENIKYKQKFATMEQWEKRAKTALEYRDEEEYWANV